MLINNEEKNNINYEPLILTLHLSKKDIEKKDIFEYNPKISEPIGIINNNYAEYEDEKIIENELGCNNIKKKYILEENGKKKENMILNNIKIENLNYPSKLKNGIHCWWCCHTFTTMVYYLPERYINNVFNVKGYFCSFSCMLSYNKQINDNDVWNRVNLIYLMNKLMFKENAWKEIPYALPRETLKIFGGYLTIDEFRKKNTRKLDTNINIYYPPMIPLIPQIEESETINYKDWEHNVSYFMKKASDSIKFKRSKPLLNKKHTLDMYMNIKNN